MDCTQAQEEFAALLDGELAPEERAAVEGHLSQCSDCLRDLDGLKRVDTIYRHLSNVSAPEGLEERVREAIRPKPVLRFPDLRRRRQMSWPIVAAALFLLVAAAAVVQFGFRVRDEQMTVASLERGADAPAHTPASAPPSAPEAPAEAKAEIAMDAVAPAEAQTDMAVESPASAEAQPEVMEPAVAPLNAPAPPEAMEKADVEARTSIQSMKSKGISVGVERKADTLRADEVQGTPPPAAEAAPGNEFFSIESEPPAEAARGGASPPAAPLMEMAAPALEAAPMAEAAPPVVAAAPPAVVAEKAAAEKALPRIEEVGKRTFELRNGIWYEAGFKDQETTRLVRGSGELRKLISAHSELGRVLELGERVVFKADGKWYRVDPRAGR